jgi:Cu/Ag efflux pump CusA
MPQVQVDPQRLKAQNVSLDQIMSVTADALDVGLLQFSNGAIIGTGGFIDTPNQRLMVRHVLPIVGSNDLAQVPVADKMKADGTPLRLSDVANIVEDHQPLIGDAVVNAGPGLLLVVEKYPWANTLQVTRGVEDALAALRPGLPGIVMDSTIFRPADFIETAINNLTTALLLGCILVVLVLGAFLFEWRTALISLVAIPLSLVAGGLVLYLQGTTINTMILAGFVIAVGVVVDDAITLEVRSAIIYATLIILLAVVPIFFIGGVSGAFFQPLVWAYGLAVLASMLVALTVTRRRNGGSRPWCAGYSGAMSARWPGAWAARAGRSQRSGCSSWWAWRCSPSWASRCSPSSRSATSWCTG